jgi:serine protein kinase
MRLVQVFKSAAFGYGTEKRVLLLHGPVGSAKSTIARLLKKGLEAYSRTNEGALYTWTWELPDALKHVAGGANEFPCPMNEEPLRLIPQEWRHKVFEELGLYANVGYPLQLSGDPNPACRFIYRELMHHYAGDWAKVMSHIRVKRLVLSEKDRVGIGTFQPKDEKNQDSPSSPATSTTGRSPSTAPTPTRARSTSTASSTSRTAASSSSSRC